jgi:hypothetical protein
VIGAIDAQTELEITMVCDRQVGDEQMAPLRLATRGLFVDVPTGSRPSPHRCRNASNVKRSGYAVGPVEHVIIQFPGNHFRGEIVPAMAKLIESETVRIIDLIFIMKDADGR